MHQEFNFYDGWIADLRLVVLGGAPDQGALDAAVDRLRVATLL